MIELNPFLQPIDTPVTSKFMTDAYKFGYTNERGAVTGMFIQDASINTAKIQDAAINNAKIGTAAIGTANIGTLTFNEIAGGTAVLGGTANGNGLLQIKDASGSVIIQGDNLGHHYYGTTGAELIKIDESGLTGYGTAGEMTLDINRFGLNTYGVGGINFHSGTSATSSGYLIAGTAGDFLMVASNNHAINIFAEDTDVNITANQDIDIIGAKSDITALSGNVTLTASGSVNVLCSSDFTINGTAKTAIVPTSKGYKALYTNESPDVWFMDFCENKDKIDPTFLEVTSPPYHFIKCEDGEYQVWGKRKGFEHLRFESKTKEEFDRNTIFWSEQKHD